MGKYEVSRGMIDAYNAIYGTANSLEISMYDPMPGGSESYKPAGGITWNEAARFVNWLNTSQGYSAAYKFTTGGVDDDISVWSSGDAGYDANNPFRNSNALYVLPSVDEWYKAAYYDPDTGAWREYASLNGDLPVSVSSGTADNTAVWNRAIEEGPASVYEAGGLTPYGVMALNGNAVEWNETASDLTNDDGSEDRILRGGSWFWTSDLAASSPRSFWTKSVFQDIGFRVVSLASVSSSSSSSTGTVPEPTTFAIWGVMGLAGFGGIRRRRNRSQQDEPSQVSES